MAHAAAKSAAVHLGRQSNRPGTRPDAQSSQSPLGLRSLRPIDGRHVARVQRLELREYLFFTQYRRRGDGFMQHRRSQGAARVFGDGCKAEMPGFGLDARDYAAKRAEKSEPGGIGLQPYGQRSVGPAGCEFLRREPGPIVRRGGARVDEIEIRTPVMPARTGKSGPQ